MQSDQIFNERGMLRDDLENVKVPPERQAVFDALVAAVRGAEAAEEDCKRKDAAVTDAVRQHTQAVAAAPKSDFMTEWRAAVGKPAMPPSQPGAAGQGAVSNGDFGGDGSTPPLSIPVAEKALELARVELRQSRTALILARERVGKTLANFNASAPTITAEQNVRDWIKSNNEDRARRVAANGHYKPNVTQTAKAMGGGNRRAGGGAAYRRGPDGQRAYTKVEAATLNAQRIAAARAKLP